MRNIVHHKKQEWMQSALVHGREIFKFYQIWIIFGKSTKQIKILTMRLQVVRSKTLHLQKHNMGRVFLQK